MKRVNLLMMIFVSSFGFAQTVSQDTTATKNQQKNAAQNILSGNGSQNGITIGGYAEIDYNQPEGANGI